MPAGSAEVLITSLRPEVEPEQDENRERRNGRRKVKYSKIFWKIKKKVYQRNLLDINVEYVVVVTLLKGTSAIF